MPDIMELMYRVQEGMGSPLDEMLIAQYMLRRGNVWLPELAAEMIKRGLQTAA